MFNTYQNEINNLNELILNWNTLSNCKQKEVLICGRVIDTEMGLCHNAFLYTLPLGIRSQCFETFPDFSGIYSYPLGREEWKNSVNKFNVERLRLAKHVRNKLEELGKIEQTKLTKFCMFIAELYKSKFVCWLTILAIFFIVLSILSYSIE